MSQQATGGNRKIRFTALAPFTLLFALCGSAEAQQSTKISQIAFLGGSTEAALLERLEAFRQGLRELGYIEGKNIVIEYRYGEGHPERLPALA